MGDGTADLTMSRQSDDSNTGKLRGLPEPVLFTEPCSAGVSWRFRGPGRPLSQVWPDRGRSIPQVISTGHIKENPQATGHKAAVFQNDFDDAVAIRHGRFMGHTPRRAIIRHQQIMDHADLAKRRRIAKPGGPKGKDEKCRMPGHPPWLAKRRGRHHADGRRTCKFALAGHAARVAHPNLMCY
jgi:hypothetical protein